jgi:hypothetical protein
MLVGVDWGGTKVEALAMTEDVVERMGITTAFSMLNVRSKHSHASGVRGAAWSWADDLP